MAKRLTLRDISGDESVTTWTWHLVVMEIDAAIRAEKRNGFCKALVTHCGRAVEGCRALGKTHNDIWDSMPWLRAHGQELVWATLVDSWYDAQDSE